MVEGIGKKISANPFILIGIFIGARILVDVITSLFPLLISAFLGLGSLANFTFSSLFVDDALIEIILSAVALIGALAVVGVKVSGAASKR